MSRGKMWLFGLIVAGVLFAFMALVIRATPAWANTATPNADPNNSQTIADTLFGPQVIAFEVLGVLLTAAMIGALVIARPLDVPADDTHYVKPTAAQLAETHAASDPKQHPTAAPEMSK